MRSIIRFFQPIACSFLLLAAPAHATSLEDTYATWEALRAPDTASIRFTDGYTFLSRNPAWPEEKLIRLRTEAAAMAERPEREAMAKFCADYPPISGRGMIACVVAGVGDVAAQKTMLRTAWVEGDFSEDEEASILKTYGETLARADHVARTDRLLYDGKLGPATRMLELIPTANHRLFNVRMALLAGEKTAPNRVNELSAAEQRDAGVLFERIRWRKRSGDGNTTDLLLAAPHDAPYADRWWPMRANAARDAISKRNYARAHALMNHHGDLNGEDLADALWMKGWLLLRHKNDAGNAYKAFFKLYTAVTTPVSKARAAYWAARAANKNGNHDIAEQWLEKAARHPTVFYGQLARAWMKPKGSLVLSPAPIATDAERAQFNADSRVRMIRLLDTRGDTKMLDLFITSLGMRIASDGQFALLAELANDVGGTHAGVDAAKLALRNAIVMIPPGWPRIKLPVGLPIEPALTLAITRQESEFNPTARSSANAQGLMQLLPSTAKQVAAQRDMPFSTSMLNEPTTNLTLGSHYLAQRINGFDGSYILGIASYNAGQGNVRKWVAAHGSPPRNLHGAIDWIESIPFSETRNYVMRVLENVSVYRSIADADAPLAIDKDLVR